MLEVEEISYSRHARDQMHERGIREKDILELLQSPDYTQRQTDGRIRGIKQIERNGSVYLLIVVYRHVPNGVKVVTAFLTSKIRKYLQ